jgi:hypothetical protein
MRTEKTRRTGHNGRGLFCFVSRWHEQEE